MADGPNLFARLHKWATRQDENFLTESLAVVLEQMLILVPEVGTRLVGYLTGGFIEVRPDDAGSIEIRSQVETGPGRPDLEICVPHRRAWVEVKVESPIRPGQLEGYRFLLGGTSEETRLILLTRYPVSIPAAHAQPDVKIRWFRVADWLEIERLRLPPDAQVASFLVTQFLDFLRERGMTLTQVGKYMPDGLRALGSLINMLTEAATACKVSIGRISADRISTGLYLNGGKAWIGLYYADPEKLWFCTCCAIDREAAARLDGEVKEEAWCASRHVWWYGAELDSEAIHFFARSKIGQMEWLEGFLADALAKARSIETPNQPPISDEPEEI